MSVANKLEAVYLNILRYAILIGATIALVVVIVGGGLALRAFTASPPAEPTMTNMAERTNDYKKEINLDAFVKDSSPAARAETPEKPKDAPAKPSEDPNTKFEKESAEKVTQVILRYARLVNSNELDHDRIFGVIRNFPKSEGIDAVEYQHFYWETIVPIFEQVEKRIPADVKNPSKGIDFDKLLRWHLQQVKASVAKLNSENQAKQDNYNERLTKYGETKASLVVYATAAGAALALFFTLILTFLMVRIEINLRPIKEIAERLGSGTT